MDDFRPEVAYSGIGGSGFGATVVGEASESKESDFLRTSLRASSSRRGGLSHDLLVSVLQDLLLLGPNLPFPEKSRSSINCLSVSEGS